MKALALDNLPTPRQEEWKYTNLPKAIPEGLARSEDEQERIVHVKRGEVCGEPVEILFTGEDGAMHPDQLKVIVEEGAELVLIERHTGTGSYWKNRATEIDIGPNGKLYHYRIQDDSAEGVNTDMCYVQMERDAHYEAFSLNIGGKLTRHEIHAVLRGENIECHFNGVNLLNGKQHGDTTIVIEHQAPHCQSNQFYRSLLDDQARGVFQGKVHVHREAQKTDGYQLANALLLSPDAEMDTKPELEIYADDVKCSHGATTGQLDEEPVFYLRSRGLSEAQARMLLMQAFVDEALDKIGDEAVRSEISGRAEEWLQKALSK